MLCLAMQRWAETYTQLNDMFARLGTKGFAPLAFPSNDFKQEYVDDAKIKTTMAAKFDPKFPMFSRVHVNGKDAAPVFKFLKERLPEGKKGKDIRHNFAKFLVDRNGQPVKRYDPSVPPLSIEEDILELLGTDSDGAAASSKPAKKVRLGLLQRSRISSCCGR